VGQKIRAVSLGDLGELAPGRTAAKAARYGELNLVVPLDKGAELKGLQGWQAPDPGSRHSPEVRGGAIIALFYLPAGRISYDFTAPS
jgi:hypothetical protein